MTSFNFAFLKINLQIKCKIIFFCIVCYRPFTSKIYADAAAKLKTK